MLTRRCDSIRQVWRWEWHHCRFCQLIHSASPLNDCHSSSTATHVVCTLPPRIPNGGGGFGCRAGAGERWPHRATRIFINFGVGERAKRAGTSLCTCSCTRHIHEWQVHFQSLGCKWTCLSVIVSRTAALTGEVPARPTVNWTHDDAPRGRADTDAMIRFLGRVCVCACLRGGGSRLAAPSAEGLMAP